MKIRRTGRSVGELLPGPWGLGAFSIRVADIKTVISSIALDELPSLSEVEHEFRATNAYRSSWVLTPSHLAYFVLVPLEWPRPILMWSWSNFCGRLSDTEQGWPADCDSQEASCKWSKPVSRHHALADTRQRSACTAETTHHEPFGPGQADWSIRRLCASTGRIWIATFEGAWPTVGLSGPYFWSLVQSTWPTLFIAWLGSLSLEWSFLRTLQRSWLICNAHGRSTDGLCRWLELPGLLTRLKAPPLLVKNDARHPQPHMVPARSEWWTHSHKTMDASRQPVSRLCFPCPDAGHCHRAGMSGSVDRKNIPAFLRSLTFRSIR